MAAVDQAVIVSELTVPSLHAAADMCRDIDALRGEGDKARLVLNRMFQKKQFRAGFPIDQAEKAIERKIDVTVTSDWDAARTAVNLGKPIANVKPKSALVMDVDSLAKPVLRHVKVLAVDQSFESNLEGAKPSQTVTLEVTPEDALVLGAASQRAALGLALISRDEEAMVAALTPAPKPVEVKRVVQPATVRRVPSNTTVRVINGENDVEVSAPIARAETGTGEKR